METRHPKISEVTKPSVKLLIRSLPDEYQFYTMKLNSLNSFVDFHFANYKEIETIVPKKWKKFEISKLS